MRRSMLGITTILLLALGLAPAYAETVTVRDAKHDAVRDSAQGTSPAPREGRADITTLVIRHAEPAVTMTLNVRQGLGTQETYASFSMKTPTGRYTAYGYRDGRSFDASLRKGSRRVVCEGLRMTMAPAGDAIRAVVPRACLNAPSWVQADAFLERVLERDPNTHAVMDTAGARGGLPEHPHFSRRVQLG